MGLRDFITQGKDEFSQAPAGQSIPIVLMSQIEVMYSSAILALRQVSLEVREGQTVALLGPNGAGKSTTLKSISCLLKSEHGSVTKGSIQYKGRDTAGWDSYTAVHSGIVQVLEGRQVFPHLTVEQNLLVSGYARKLSKSEIREGLEMIYQYFPRLKTRRTSRAGYTSGGEQQMVAIGRALMLRPHLILLDEPSMGLAPLVVEEIFEIIGNMSKAEKVSFLLAEQNASIALRYADYAYLIETGRIVMSGDAETLMSRKDVQELYLGLGNDGSRISFRNAKSYHRRKRIYGM